MKASELPFSRFTPHAVLGDTVLSAVGGSRHGLTHSEATARLEHYGRNTLPRPRPPSVARVFLHQFLSPLIYVLVAAALLSLAIQHWSDAGFIFAVLLVNAVIGTVQEYSAQRAAGALHELVTTTSRVLREGDAYEIDAEELVPGDIVFLESGDKIPADVRLLTCYDLQVDESLLTGESIPVLKYADELLDADIALGDRAILGVLAYTAARVGAIAKLKRRHYIDMGEQRVIRFAEKGGKSREIPVRHDLAQWPDAYLDAAGGAGEGAEAPLFRSARGKTRRLTEKSMSAGDICRMVKRRLKAAGLPARLSPHSFQVTAATDLLNQDVPLADVQYLLGHADPRTTRIYDRRPKQVTCNLVERISI